MKILGIDTSCDETAIAVLKGNKNGDLKILSNIISSQIELHQEYGGVYPSVAKREHQKNLVPVLAKSLDKSKLLMEEKKEMPEIKKKKLNDILKREKDLSQKLIKFLENFKKPEIDAIAVTVGPGLEPCLYVGVNFTKAISWFWDMPIIPINHIEAHVLSAIIEEDKNKIFPAIALVVSGGHTELISTKKIGNYEIIGETRDDAAGECFDKTARILGLPYPGGPIISELSDKARKEKIKSEKMPRPMLNTDDYDFSFSGLKTAVLYEYRKQEKQKKESEEYIKGMARGIEEAIIEVLSKKTINASKEYNAKSIILGGGVSANKKLREILSKQAKKEGFSFYSPKPGLSTDNGAMIAAAGYYKNKETVNWKNLQVDANLRI